MNKYCRVWFFSKSCLKECNISIWIKLPAISKYFSFLLPITAWTIAPKPSDEIKLSLICNSYRVYSDAKKLARACAPSEQIPFESKVSDLRDGWPFKASKSNLAPAEPNWFPVRSNNYKLVFSISFCDRIIVYYNPIWFQQSLSDTKFFKDLNPPNPTQLVIKTCCRLCEATNNLPSRVALLISILSNSESYSNILELICFKPSIKSIFKQRSQSFWRSNISASFF